MRLLWASNSPYNGSGYGVQTGLVAPRLQAAGHDIAIAANYGLEGSMLSLPGPRGPIPMYPKGGEPHSIAITGEHAEHWQADVILTHYDAWVYEPQRFFKRPWVPWYPVDCDGLQTQVEEKIRHAAFRITQTRHGQEATKAKGLQCEYVPAGFDGSSYRPVDGGEWRDGAGFPRDAFLVAMVAANKGAPGAPSRKSFPQLFEGFARFAAEHGNAYLYVHTVAKAHLDLVDLAARYRIQDRVGFAHPYQLMAGHVSPQDMATIYSAADVLLSPSMGEGFGVPILEAQACGTPVITGDWTSMSEITRTGYAIPKERAIRYPVPHQDAVYGDMFIVDPTAVAEALADAVTWKHAPADVAAAVAEYEIERVFAEHWLPVVEKLEHALRRPNAPNPAGNRAMRRAARRQKITGPQSPAAA